MRSFLGSGAQETCFKFSQHEDYFSSLDVLLQAELALGRVQKKLT